MKGAFGLLLNVTVWTTPGIFFIAHVVLLDDTTVIWITTSFPLYPQPADMILVNITRPSLTQKPALLLR